MPLPPAQALFFPHETIRQSQQQLLEDVGKGLGAQKHLLCHAPTGLGKTAAVLSPAMELALREHLTVFFLTPKISQHEIALKVADGLRQRSGVKIRALDLVGRKFLCLDPLVAWAEQSGFHELCRRKREKESCSYFGNSTGYSELQRIQAGSSLKVVEQQAFASAPWDHLRLKEFCRDFETERGNSGLCPYEVALHLGKSCQLVIADYYYLFNPKIRKLVLGRLGKKLPKCILIVDEAHNLPERLRRLSSSSLSVRQIEKAAGEAARLGERQLASELKKIRKELLNEAEVSSPGSPSWMPRVSRA